MPRAKDLNLGDVWIQKFFFAIVVWSGAYVHTLLPVIIYHIFSLQDRKKRDTLPEPDSL